MKLLRTQHKKALPGSRASSHVWELRARLFTFSLSTLFSIFSPITETGPGVEEEKNISISKNKQKQSPPG